MISNNSTVYISYATDSNYIAPTCVSLFSLAKNACGKRRYEVYVIVPEEVDDYEQKQLGLSVSSYENVAVNIIVADTLSVKTTMTHISNVTYYKCFLMRYLPEKVDKCAWVDSDTIVSGDIGELYDIDIGDDYLGGVTSYGISNSWTFSERILLREKTHYLNAGILLMNLYRMRKGALEVIMDSLVPLQYPTQDQDVLNVACYGRKTVLPMKYNFQPIRLAQRGTGILEQFSWSDILEAMRTPLVVHYLTSEKPWHKPQYDYKLLWRNYYSELLKTLPQLSEGFSINLAEQYSYLNYHLIETAETVIFYGAGFRSIKTLGLCNMFNLRRPDLMWDANSENIKDVFGTKVEKPYDNVDCLNKDKTLIIVCNDNVTMQNNIKDDFEKVGFSMVYNAADYALAMWEKGLAKECKS